MMRNVLSLYLLLSPVLYSTAQTLGDVNRSSSLTWYGIDFTQARFLNFNGAVTSYELNNYSLISEWSHSPLQDADENFIRRKFDKKNLSVDIASTRSRNSSIDYAASLSSGMHEIDVDAVKKVIAESDISGNGYGVLFVVESFDNTNIENLV